MWEPTLSAFVLTVAVPPTRGAVSVGPPVMVNVTVPVGVPEPGAIGVTVAVIVTVCPKADGSGEEATVVWVNALVTAWMVEPVDR